MYRSLLFVSLLFWSSYPRLHNYGKLLSGAHYLIGLTDEMLVLLNQFLCCFAILFREMPDLPGSERMPPLLGCTYSHAGKLVCHLFYC